MNEILNFLFQQYGSYSQVDIGLEIFAVFFGFLSVWFSKNNNVLVFHAQIAYAVQDFALKYKFFHTVHMNILFFHGFVDHV